MKYLWTTLTVADMEKSLDFYQNVVGLPLQSRRQAGPTTELAFLGDGEVKIELIYHKGVQVEKMGKAISMGFEVADIDEFIIYLKTKGIEVAEGPFSPNPHIKFFYVLDPNGLRIQFVQNL